jgi:hypothetical protein
VKLVQSQSRIPPEYKSVAGDFAETLKKTQRKVFEVLAYAAFTTEPWTDWQTLRQECWPRSISGGIDQHIKRTHVYETVEAVKKKAATWSIGRGVCLKIADSRDGHHAMKWSLRFAAAPVSEVTDQRPEFGWWLSGSQEKRILPIWVPAFSCESVEINIHPTEPWACHNIIPDYSTFRETVWREHQKQRCLNQLSPPVNTFHWHVASCIPRSAPKHTHSRIHLVVQQIEFKDFLATTQQLSTEISVRGEPISVKKLFHSKWAREDHQHFPAAANLLAVDVNIITRDKKLLVRRESSEGPWETAVFGYVNALEDVHRDEVHVPTVRETAFRTCCRLLGFRVDPAHIRWLGVGLGTRKGNVSVFGEIEVPYTLEQVQDLFATRVDKEKSYEISAIDLTPANLLELLDREEKHRRHMEVALVLSVHRRCPDLKILTTALPSQSHTVADRALTDGKVMHRKRAALHGIRNRGSVG